MTGLSRHASGSRWAVASPHFSATDAAAEAFGAGGNALDAALAAATTLAVVYPHMCGVGGDLIALIRDPSGKTTCVMSAGAAPTGVDTSAVRARWSSMPAHGPDTVTVPGAVAGWGAIHDAGAVLPWSAAFARATEHAREGVPASRDLAAALAWEPERLRSDPGLAQVFFSGDVSEGSPVVQPALASTLIRLADAGPQEFYRGDVGRRFVRGMSSLGSNLSSDDLASHRAWLVRPLTRTYRARTVLTAPPPSQGFALLRILRRIESLGLTADPLGTSAPDIADLFGEAGAIRDAHLADPGWMRLDVDQLIEEEVPDSDGRMSPQGAGDTISLMCADASGWAVSLIQSLYDGFGSGILELDTGVIAHNRGACFTLDPGHPNELLPGKRPAHTLMPVMVEGGTALEFVTGTMGGEAQPQINAQNLMHVLDMGRPPQDALAAARWTVRGSVATLEEGVPASVGQTLAGAGLTIERTERHSGDLGHSNIIACGPAGFAAASDPRSDGSAAAGS